MSRKAFSRFFASLLLLFCLAVATPAQTNYVTLQNAAAATANGEVLPASRTPNSTVTVQVTGTFVATVTFEASEDGTNWSAVRAVNQANGAIGATAVAPGIYLVPVGSVESFRARVSAYTSGSVTVTARAGSGLLNNLDPVGGGVKFSCVVSNSSATALTALGGSCAAPGAGLSLYVTDIEASASAASTTTADQQLELKYGTGGTCGTGTAVLWNQFAAANQPVISQFATPLKVPANNELCWMNAVVGNKSFVVSGYIAP